MTEDEPNQPANAEQAKEVKKLKDKLKHMELHLSRKNDLLTDVQAQFLELEKEVESYKTRNGELEDRIESLEEQLSRSIERKSSCDKIAVTNIEEVSSNDRGSGHKIVNEDDNEDDSNISSRIESFLNLRKEKKLTKDEFMLHIISSLLSLYHVIYGSEELSGDNLTAIKKSVHSKLETKIGMYYTFEFMKQLFDVRIHEHDDNNNNSEPELTKTENPFNTYPVNWLLGMFPFSDNTSTSTSTPLGESALLPLHMMLALDTTNLSYSDYLADLELIIKHYSSTAYDEEVSPLSIAVAKKQPNNEVIELLLKYQPNAVSVEDEDGSLPLMHACAYNETTEVIAHLLSQYPEGLSKRDNFGCYAIHYAAYSGFASTVEYLIESHPECAYMTAGNGALPLHDAVQNKRLVENSSDYAVSQDIIRMLEVLMEANPQAVKSRDDSGALPLHKVAKCGNLEVFQLIYEAYPRAIFAIDSEGLLPTHYYSQSESRNLNLEIVQFILKHNPQSIMLDEAALKAYVDPSQQVNNNKRSQSQESSSSGGGWMKGLAKWASSGGGAKEPPAQTAHATGAVSGRRGSGGTAVNRRKSMAPKNGLHGKK